MSRGINHHQGLDQIAPNMPDALRKTFVLFLRVFVPWWFFPNSGEDGLILIIPSCLSNLTRNC
jgi:hypothetical protein